MTVGRSPLRFQLRGGGGGFSKAIDLCDEDYNRFVQPLLDLLTEHGRKVVQPAASPAVAARDGAKPQRRGPCLLCPVEKRRDLVLPFHARHTHDMSYHEYLVTTGQAEPSACVCFLCEPSSDIGDNRGLYAHGRSVHGMKSEVFEKANADANPAAAQPLPAEKTTPPKKAAPAT